MPHQMKAGVVCWKNQWETVAPSHKGHIEWVLILEVIINFALLAYFLQWRSMVCREQAQCCPRKLSARSSCFGHCAALCRALHNVRAWLQQIDLNSKHWTCLKWSQSCPSWLLSPFPPTYSGKGAKGQGQLMAVSVPHEGWCEPSHLLPICSLVCRSRASCQLCA